jgi:phosphoribosylformylglycinamidine synthase PurS subunit
MGRRVGREVKNSKFEIRNSKGMRLALVRKIQSLRAPRQILRISDFEFRIYSPLETHCGRIHSGGMKATVTVMPKKSVLDPQGVAVRDAMRHHGLPGVRSVRIGKFMEIEVEAADEGKLHEICRDLLSNPVIEDYELQVEA